MNASLLGLVIAGGAQLDPVTQQHAALVEEAAAAADSLNQQPARMVDVVSAFKLSGNSRRP